MPLVNEVVIGLKDKNKFNGSQPKDDAQFADYVTNPTLPALLADPLRLRRRQGADQLPAHRPGRRLPDRHRRRQQASADRAEMLRLNTSIAPTPIGSQNRLGVLGGDNAGFPNGRRPGDDVVDIELRVAMGVLCHAFPGAYCNPATRPPATCRSPTARSRTRASSIPSSPISGPPPGLAERSQRPAAQLGGPP